MHNGDGAGISEPVFLIPWVWVW